MEKLLRLEDMVTLTDGGLRLHRGVDPWTASDASDIDDEELFLHRGLCEHEEPEVEIFDGEWPALEEWFTVYVKGPVAHSAALAALSAAGCEYRSDGIKIQYR